VKVYHLHNAQRTVRIIAMILETGDAALKRRFCWHTVNFRQFHDRLAHQFTHINSRIQ